MKNNKVYIFLLILMLAFFFLMYFTIGKNHIEKSNQELTLLVGDNTIWNYSNLNWYKVSDTSIPQYNWKKFKIYLDGIYKDDYYVWHDDKWYIFDDNKQPINYSEKFLGVVANYNIKVKEFMPKEVEDSEVIYSFLSKKGISSSTELTVKTQTTFDIDDDNNQEKIYIVSNAFAIDFYPDEVFSYVFMEKNKKLYEIYGFKEKNNYNNGTKPYINSILDVDDDGQYEIIVTLAQYSNLPQDNRLYKFTKDSFKQII